MSECHMWSRVEKRCAIGGEGPAAAGGNASRSRRRRAAKGAKAKQIQGFHGKMEFHFAKQKKRFLAKSSILSKVPFYPEKPSELLEKFHFPTFLEFGHFFSCFL